MTLRDLYQEGESILTRAAVDDAAIDARLLLFKAFSLDLNSYLLERDKEFSNDNATAEKITAYRGFLKKRAQRVPLQLILGSTEFMGLEFLVRENVLIPRQDTETLVEKVLSDGVSGSLLDLCTGTGCIALSLAIKGDFSRVAAADISAEAIETAKENARRLGLETIEFYQGDLFSALPRETPPFSVITANPPYIPTGDIKDLQPEVRDHEPRLALDGSADGLEFYRRIAAKASPYLAEGGSMYLEIGADEAQAVREIFDKAGYADIEIVKDLSENDRVAVIDKPVR